MRTANERSCGWCFVWLKPGQAKLRKDLWSHEHHFSAVYGVGAAHIQKIEARKILNQIQNTYWLLMNKFHFSLGLRCVLILVKMQRNLIVWVQTIQSLVEQIASWRAPLHGFSRKFWLHRLESFDAIQWDGATYAVRFCESNRRTSKFSDGQMTFVTIVVMRYCRVTRTNKWQRAYVQFNEIKSKPLLIGYHAVPTKGTIRTFCFEKYASVKITEFKNWVETTEKKLWNFFGLSAQRVILKYCFYRFHYGQREKIEKCQKNLKITYR